MNVVLKILSYLGLGLTLVPSVLLLTGFAFPKHALLATIGMALWFATAPFWINKSSS